MVAWIEWLSEVCGKIAAWLFFIIAVMITYEVISRYLFIKPTIWAEEMSQFLQIWATYLAAAYVLKNRQLISIDIIAAKLNWRKQRMLELFSLAVIATFCVVAIYYGAVIVVESITVGRSTSTMLSVPKWMTESAIPVSFTILLLQTLVEIIRTSKSTHSDYTDNRVRPNH